MRRPVDYAGAALAAGFSSALLLVTDWGGKRYAWTSPVITGEPTRTARSWLSSNPDRQVGGYRSIQTSKFGEKVSVPGPMDIELDTEILKNYVRSTTRD
ncbi:hypothetical protein ACWCRD_36740 [Streptomyces sp. NPDC002092]